MQLTNFLVVFFLIVSLGFASIYVFRLGRRAAEPGRIRSIVREPTLPSENWQAAAPADGLTIAEFAGLVSLDGHVKACAEVELADVLTVVTPPQQWANAIWFPLWKGPSRTAGRVLIRVTGWVNAGKIGVGLVLDGNVYLQEVFRTPPDGVTTFDLIADSLADCWAVVVRNAAEQGTVSKVVIQSIRTYRILRSPPLSSRIKWVENRQEDLPPAADRSLPAIRTSDKTAPAISLVLTVKNGMPYLPKAIESVRNQNLRDFELIVQDCVSTDGSLEYLRAIDDLPIFIESEQDDGIGDAWQRAWRRCSGELLGSIDADNLLRPDALSTALAIFAEYPQAAAFYGSVELIDEDGAAQSSFTPVPFDVLELIGGQLIPPWSTAFFSRTRCGPSLYFDPEIRVCTDFDVWLRLSHLSVLQTDKILGSTRVSRASMTCRVETYDSLCSAKIQALENYLRRRSQEALNVSLMRYGTAGIYCWAAESVQRLGGGRVDVLRYTELALQADPKSDRARRIRESLAHVQ